MEQNLYNKILNNYNLAREFRKKTVEIYRGRASNSLEELSEIFHEVDGKYTLEEGKKFISDLSSSKGKWYCGSHPKCANSLSFINVKDNKIRIKINRIQYFN
jgi:hypothetical protein